MRSTTTSSACRWDGSPLRPHHRQRALRVAADSPSRLLCSAQLSRCRDCGNRIDWHTRTNHNPISLHPHEMPAAGIPATHRWHVSSGIAHPAHDGTPWCRIPHTTICPTQPASAPSPPNSPNSAAAWHSAPGACSIPASSPRHPRNPHRHPTAHADRHAP
ncbi:DUF6083 domain-containing protein [Streptomyces noursei]|uniref:DUF6083 domain-containing protein n=1 Tax=Streptomyces noursei TaxID=1971 RepID=UPI00300418C6